MLGKVTKFHEIWYDEIWYELLKSYKAKYTRTEGRFAPPPV